MTSKALKERKAKNKQWVKEMAILLRQIKKDKANAYRDNRLEDARRLEDDQMVFSQLVYRHHWYGADEERNYLLKN
jgi:hypothetical protein